MSDYADIKIKKLRRFIQYLSHKTEIQLERGGRHIDVVKYPYWERPFPLPTKHRIVNKYIVKDLMEKLIEDGIITQKEIDKIL